MSDNPSSIEAGLTVFSGVLASIKDSSIEIMRVHPVNSLLMMNLLGNIGYAIFTVPDENGNFRIGQYAWGGKSTILMPPETFGSRQELMAYIFRRVATHAGMLLQVDVATDLFKTFNFEKLLGALK